jgi:hypothetical protein
LEMFKSKILFFVGRGVSNGKVRNCLRVHEVWGKSAI